MDPFFATYKNKFNLEPIDCSGFRKCQLGAVWAVKSHFTKSEKPALISMPTGSGKTAVMIALSFELKAKKILIITPSRVIRDQIAEEFASLRILTKIGAINTEFTKKPVVEAKKTLCSSEQIWREIVENNDVIVATPKTVSSAEKNVVPPATNQFDAIFIDEAHHAPAVTWNALINEFSESKIILFTATPFRRDKKKIRAMLVYHYSITNALEDNIYRPVNYLPVVTSLDEVEKDKKIAESAFSVFEQEKSINPNVKILIKTDKITHAESLVPLYRRFGLKISTIHSDKDDDENNEIISQCKCGELQGIICVGMIGEGLDIPDLKIAVLHSIPRTLPFTIQFIGRLSRINETQIGNGYLIADPNYVKGEISSLYKHDKGWIDLIPNLVDERTNRAGFLRDHYSDYLNPYEIDLKEIEPFFSVRIYRIYNDFKFKNDFVNFLPADIDIILYDYEDENSPRVIISCVDDDLNWGKKLSLSFNRYDLHIFYVIGNILFEYTSSDYYCNKIKRSLFEMGSYERVDKEIIKNGLKDTSGYEYYMIGLANASGISRSNPKYKMFLGKEVQSALRITDGRIFSVGHALAKISNDETRGIALNNSRIWAIIRGNISDYADWCDWLYRLIESKSGKGEIPNMGFLVDTRNISSLPAEPIAVLFDDITFHTAFVTVENNGVVVSNPNPFIEIVSYNFDSNILKCELYLCEGMAPIELTFTLGESPCWHVSPSNILNMHIDYGNNEPFRGSFQEYLEDNPPLVVLATGQTLTNNSLFTPNIQTERFDRDLFISHTWKGTDLHREAREPREGYTYNVQQRTIEIIKPSLHERDILINDDGKDEIADIVVIRPQTKAIEFYHCKYKVSEGDEPGANKIDITELIDQGIRNGYWVKSSQLINRLILRLSQNSHIIKGTTEELEELNKAFYTHQWSYKIILVQPAIKKDILFFDETVLNIEKLLCTLFDRTIGIDAELEVWGS